MNFDPPPMLIYKLLYLPVVWSARKVMTEPMMYAASISLNLYIGCPSIFSDHFFRRRLIPMFHPRGSGRN